MHKYDNDYEGENLIFLTGAPGSRWSSAHNRLTQGSSDFSPSELSSTFWRMRTVQHSAPFIAGHGGIYWGPGNLLGQKFDNLHNCSKEYILDEINKGFTDNKGVRLVKSHWFSYNLNYLANMFPKAKIILCYADELECFYWWHKCGGWGMPYPNYTWYENDEGMLRRIKEENYNILKFCSTHNLQLEYQTISSLCQSLGVKFDKIKDAELNCKTAVFTGEIVADFTHLWRSGFASKN